MEVFLTTNPTRELRNSSRSRSDGSSKGWGGSPKIPDFREISKTEGIFHLYNKWMIDREWSV